MGLPDLLAVAGTCAIDLQMHTYLTMFIVLYDDSDAYKPALPRDNPYILVGQKRRCGNVETCQWSKSANVNVSSRIRRDGIQGVELGLEDHRPACRVDVILYVLIL